MNKDFLNRALAASILLSAGCLAAQSTQAIEPRNVQAGPFYIAPTLDVAARYVDNLFRLDEDKKSTWVTEYTPKLLTWLQDGNNTYSLSYQLEDSHYASSHDDDFTDHRANLDLHHEFNVRNVLNINGEYYDGHEERGTGLTEGEIAELIDEPVEYESNRIGGDYTYGNRLSRGRLELAARTVQITPAVDQTFGGTWNEDSPLIERDNTPCEAKDLPWHGDGAIPVVDGEPQN